MAAFYFFMLTYFPSRIDVLLNNKIFISFREILYELYQTDIEMYLPCSPAGSQSRPEIQVIEKLRL